MPTDPRIEVKLENPGYGDIVITVIGTHTEVSGLAEFPELRRTLNHIFNECPASALNQSLLNESLMWEAGRAIRIACFIAGYLHLPVNL